MKIEDLKKFIESKNILELSDKCFVFKVTDNDFIATQYYREMANILGKDILVVDSLQDIPTSFMFDVPNSLYVYRTDKLDYYKFVKNCVIICNKISVECDYIDFPKIEPWQIKEYANSLLPGLSNKNIDTLTSMFSDIFRLDNEISKLSVFNGTYKDVMFQKFIEDNMYDDISNKSIFDFSNAVQKKDVKSLLEVYKKLEQSDVEPLGLVTILYKNFRNMISVWCQSNPTVENTGLKSNQLWAINKLPKVYSYDQLMNAFTLMCNVDSMLKSGNITTDIIVDYIVVNLL